MPNPKTRRYVRVESEIERGRERERKREKETEREGDREKKKKKKKKKKRGRDAISTFFPFAPQPFPSPIGVAWAASRLFAVARGGIRLPAPATTRVVLHQHTAIHRAAILARSGSL